MVAPVDSQVAAIELTDAAVALGGRTIWRDVSVAVKQGEFVAVLGPNGAGKSTLMKAILGLIPLASGSLSVLGQRPGRLNHDIGYLPQRRSFDPATRVRGIDLVRLGLDGDRYGLSVPLSARARERRRSARERVDEVIELVGASAYARRPIGECSGGEQQRLLIAQALVLAPRLLILDEPLDSLDLPNQAAVAALIRDICVAEGVTVLLVAHDVNPLLGYLDRVIYLAGGGVLTGRVRDVVTTANLSRLYDTPVEVLETSDGRLVVVGQPEAPHHHSDRHA